VGNLVSKSKRSSQIKKKTSSLAGKTRDEHMTPAAVFLTQPIERYAAPTSVITMLSPDL